jgi:hypothetical protein
MEELARLVADSLARHGYDAPVDHRRLEWSRWFRCESSLSLLLVPPSPGIYALGEEVGAAAPSEGSSGPIVGKRMLAVFEIAETDDLSHALARLFAPTHPLCDRLTSGRCFARYARVADPGQRNAAFTALRQWLASSIEVATGFGAIPIAPAEPSPRDLETGGDGCPQPSGRGVRGSSSPAIDVASRVATRRSPPPLPTGF